MWRVLQEVDRVEQVARAVVVLEDVRVDGERLGRQAVAAVGERAGRAVGDGDADLHQFLVADAVVEVEAAPPIADLRRPVAGGVGEGRRAQGAADLAPGDQIGRMEDAEDAAVRSVAGAVAPVLAAVLQHERVGAGMGVDGIAVRLRRRLAVHFGHGLIYLRDRLAPGDVAPGRTETGPAPASLMRRATGSGAGTHGTGLPSARVRWIAATSRPIRAAGSTLLPTRNVALRHCVTIESDNERRARRRRSSRLVERPRCAWQAMRGQSAPPPRRASGAMARGCSCSLVSARHRGDRIGLALTGAG